MYSTLREQLPEVPVYTGGFHRDQFMDTDFIVLSPGVAPSEPAIEAARARGKEIIGDVELFLREIDVPVLAVTGSNGKSTVTALVGDMCRHHGLQVIVAGNIGMPVLDFLGDQTISPDCFVLELSSFQLESTYSLRARAAVILNLSEDHMDRYPEFDQYIRAKGRIFAGNGVAVVNRDDPNVMRALPDGKTAVSFGDSAPPGDEHYGLVEADGAIWLAKGNTWLLPADSVPLTGRHNLLNAQAALALAEQMGVSADSGIQAIREFRGLPHRMELITHQHGVHWINDSKATNVGATVAALNGLSAPVVLIAGGDAKGADFSPLRDPVAKHARAVVLLGRDADEIERVIADVVPTIAAADMSEAVALAKTLAVAGDVVLLAPACASFDMYDNFEQRGEHFKTSVYELV